MRRIRISRKKSSLDATKELIEIARNEGYVLGLKEKHEENINSQELQKQKHIKQNKTREDLILDLRQGNADLHREFIKYKKDCKYKLEVLHADIDALESIVATYRGKDRYAE